jgi:hypothetical protein
MTKKSKLDALAFEVASGSTIRAAAKKLGISESHAYTISSGDPEFRVRVSEIRTEAIGEAVGRLSVIVSKAVDALEELLAATNEPKDRLAAAKTILGAVAPMSELGELRARIDAIESQGPGLKVAR